MRHRACLFSRYIRLRYTFCAFMWGHVGSLFRMSVVMLLTCCSFRMVRRRSFSVVFAEYFRFG